MHLATNVNVYLIVVRQAKLYIFVRAHTNCIGAGGLLYTSAFPLWTNILIQKIILVYVGGGGMLYILLKQVPSLSTWNICWASLHLVFLILKRYYLYILNCSTCVNWWTKTPKHIYSWFGSVLLSQQSWTHGSKYISRCNRVHCVLVSTKCIAYLLLPRRPIIVVVHTVAHVVM